MATKLSAYCLVTASDAFVGAATETVALVKSYVPVVASFPGVTALAAILSVEIAPSLILALLILSYFFLSLVIAESTSCFPLIKAIMTLLFA